MFGKGVYKRLHAKNKAIMDLRASKKSGNHKQMMAGKKVKEEAAPKEATATPSR